MASARLPAPRALYAHVAAELGAALEAETVVDAADRCQESTADEAEAIVDITEALEAERVVANAEAERLVDASEHAAPPRPSGRGARKAGWSALPPSALGWQASPTHGAHGADAAPALVSSRGRGRGAPVVNSRGRGRALARALVVGGALARSPQADAAPTPAAAVGRVGLARLQSAPALSYSGLLRPLAGAVAAERAPVLGAPSAAPTPVAWPLGGVEHSPHVISPGEGGMPPTLRLAELEAGTFVVLVAMVVGARPAFAVPSSAGCLFGAPSLSEGSRKSRDADVAVGLGWARRLIALPALPVAWLAGEADSAGGAVLRVIVVPMVGSLGDACPRLPRQTAQAVGWGWTDITGVASGDGALVVGSAAARVQSFVQAGAHSPMALRVGRGATMAVGGSSGAATRACFAARVAAAEYAVASLRVGLQRAQRASAGTLAAFFGQLGERVLPLPLGEIPEALRAEVVLYDDAALDLHSLGGTMRTCRTHGRVRRRQRCRIAGRRACGRRCVMLMSSSRGASRRRAAISIALTSGTERP